MGWFCSQKSRICGSERMIELAAARLRLRPLTSATARRSSRLARTTVSQNTAPASSSDAADERCGGEGPASPAAAAAAFRPRRPRRQRPARRQGSPQRAPSARVIFQPLDHGVLMPSGSVQLRGTRRPKTRRSDGQRPGGIAPAKRRINSDYADRGRAWPDARAPGGLQRGVCRYGAAGKTHLGGCHPGSRECSERLSGNQRRARRSLTHEGCALLSWVPGLAPALAVASPGMTGEGR